MRDDMQRLFSLAEQRAVLRLLRFLAKAPAQAEDMAQSTRCLLTNIDGANLAFDRAFLQKISQYGAVSCNNDSINLTDLGRDLLPVLKELSVAQIKTEPDAERETDIRSTGTQQQKPQVNAAESPLAMLYRQNRHTGKRFLSDEEFQAGERLRADFTRGNMMPRISANWEAGVAGRVRGERGGAAELSDYALDCRDRVHQALQAVGPELSGVLLDICCFLKGLEQVERERIWPARSAKMLLKTGLSILHRYYNARRGAKQTGRPMIYHWGDSDYRPSL